MQNITDLLNKNQGVLEVIIFLLASILIPLLIWIIKKFFARKTYSSGAKISAGRDINVGRDLIVNGNENIEKGLPDGPLIEIADSSFQSNQGIFTFTLYLRNIGDRNATVKEIILADEVLPVSSFIVSTKPETVKLSYDITNFSILINGAVSPKIEIKYVNSNGKKRSTFYDIALQHRADERFNIIKLENPSFSKLE